MIFLKADFTLESTVLKSVLMNVKSLKIAIEWSGNIIYNQNGRAEVQLM